MSVLGHRIKKDISILDKPIPRNPKYDEVTSKLDTGRHVKNVKKKWDTSGEIFTRIDRKRVYHMICTDPRDENVNAFFDVQSVVDSNYDMNDGGVEVLIVDIRTPEEFHLCHIDGAINFPAIMLRRDQWLRELYDFRNKKGKLIVLYDNDGVSPLGIETATTFVRKRWDNVSLLHGGLYGFTEMYPEITFGRIERPPSPPKSGRRRRKSSTSKQNRKPLARSRASNQSSLSSTWK